MKAITLPTGLFLSLVLIVILGCFLSLELAAQSPTIRLRDVPLTEYVLGEKKQFKFDFRNFIPDSGKETQVYMTIRFCYKGQNFIVRKRISSPRFTYTQKYFVNQVFELRINSHEGLAYCVCEIQQYYYSLCRCNPYGMELEWVKVEEGATEFKRS